MLQRAVISQPSWSFSKAAALATWNTRRHNPASRYHLRCYSTGPSERPSTDPQSDRPEVAAPPRETSSGRANDPLAQVKDRLRKWSETTATSARQRIDEYTATLGAKFSELGKEINRVTGYGEIEALKRRVVEQEARIEAVRRGAREAKEACDKAVRQRAASQREVNELLQRKSSWSDDDVVRFTSLVRQDHLYEQEESRTKLAVLAAEDAVEREFSELMRVILNRYHEEQAWSDKIRSASTYGSLAVMGANLAVFVIAILFVEPWKRKRLAQTFERKVEEMEAEHAKRLEEASGEFVRRLEGQEKMLAQITEMVHYSTQAPDVDTMVSANEDESPQAERISHTEVTQEPPVLKTNHEIAIAIATSATTAGIVGWLAKSWFG